MKGRLIMRLCAVVAAIAILAGCGGPAPTAEIVVETVEVPVVETVEVYITEEPTVTYERSETLYVSGSAWGPPNDWNPFITWSKANTTGVCGFVYEPLFFYDPLTGEFMPWLAESGEWVDEDTYALTIREGITWSDGEDLLADDVAFTFEVGQMYAAIWFSPMWEYLDSITVEDDYNLTFEFTDPLYQKWSNNLYNIFIVPSTCGQTKQKRTSPVV